MQLGMITNVNDGQVEKLESIMLLLNNYVGQIKEQSLELIDYLFSPIFDKISQIPVPKSNTSDIEKAHIRVVIEYFRLL